MIYHRPTAERAETVLWIGVTLWLSISSRSSAMNFTHRSSRLPGGENHGQDDLKPEYLVGDCTPSEGAKCCFLYDGCNSHPDSSI